jgi:signal transduction histidine kinase
MFTQWAHLSLALQYAVASSIVLMLGMGSIGYWVSSRIEAGVVQNTATATAVYMDSVLAPLLQDLASSDSLSAPARQRIDALLDDTEIGRRIHSFKVWQEGGRIAYSTRAELIGRRFPPTENLIRGWQGVVSADLDDLRDEEDALERSAGIHLLEIYAPIRETGSNRIIAVAEFYARANDLKKDLTIAGRQSWLVVGLSTLGMMAALFGIVARGSRTIEQQRARLEMQVAQLKGLLDDNRQLQLRVERAYRSSALVNERFLRRVGADLHDGPAQLVGLALLKLDTVNASGEAAASAAEPIRSALRDTLVEIRRISAGLALPELKGASLAEAIELAIRTHETRTGTGVARSIGALPLQVPDDVVVGVYRFVQEGLTNAFRHASGLGQNVSARWTDGRLVVAVADAGEGLSDLQPAAGGFTGIGLAALRDRIEALGGSLSMQSQSPQGTRLTAVFEARTLESFDA